MELESQLAQLREQEAYKQRITHAQGALGMYNLTRDMVATIGESVSGTVELVEKTISSSGARNTGPNNQKLVQTKQDLSSSSYREQAPRVAESY